jgi:hypothetical protein
METTQKITEQMLDEAIATNKIVYAIRKNGEINHLETFDSINELKKHLDEKFEGIYGYKTAKEAYLSDCNFEYYAYLSADILNNLEDDEEEIANIFKNIKSYGEFTSNFKESDYVDGIYDLMDNQSLIMFDENNKIYNGVHYVDGFEDIIPFGIMVYNIKLG